MVLLLKPVFYLFHAACERPIAVGRTVYVLHDLALGGESRKSSLAFLHITLQYVLECGARPGVDTAVLLGRVEKGSTLRFLCLGRLVLKAFDLLLEFPVLVFQSGNLACRLLKGVNLPETRGVIRASLEERMLFLFF